MPLVGGRGATPHRTRATASLSSSPPSRRPSLLARLADRRSDHVAGHDELDAAVLLTPFASVFRRDRIARAVATGRDPLARQSLHRQEIADRVGALLRQPLIQ